MIFFDDSITKEMADRCITHHHACDCREYMYRKRIAELEAALDARRKESELKHHYQITLEQRIEALEAEIPRWIPVTEKLPDEEVPVLVCGQPWPDQIRTALIAWEEWEGRWCWHWEIMTSHYALNDRDAYEWYDNYEFTHWMPLPKAALLPGGE